MPEKVIDKPAKAFVGPATPVDIIIKYDSYCSHQRIFHSFWGPCQVRGLPFAPSPSVTIEYRQINLFTVTDTIYDKSMSGSLGHFRNASLSKRIPSLSKYSNRNLVNIF